MKRFIQKTLCVTTVLCFLTTSLSWGLPEAGIKFAPAQEIPSFLQVEIPQDLASIEEVYEAPARPDPKLILHIQNIHGNYEAQIQIKKLLQFLYEKYGFKLIFVEGAIEKLNPDYLRLFPDKQLNVELADYLTHLGELTGPEFRLIDGPNDVEAIGVEQADLYRKNYEAFKKVYAAKPEADNFLQKYEERLEMLASRILPTETRRLLGEWKKFESGHRDFLPYVRKLADDAKKVLGLDLESLFAQVEWPQMTRLLVLQSMETELDRPAAEREKIKLIEFLNAQKVAPEIVKAIQNLGEKKITMARADSAERRLEDLPRYLFERLVEEAGPKGFRFHDYPAFSLWAGYLILQSELDSRILFEEVARIFQKILDEMVRSESEKNLLELYRDEDLTRKLLNFQLTRKDWEKANYRRDWIQPEPLIRRLKKIHQDMAKMEGKPEADEIDGADSPKDAYAKLSDIFNTAFSFYDYAREREATFMSVIQKEMASRKAEKAVLVTGGFHTEGLEEIFREQDINYSVLMPRITQGADTSNYVSSMLENKPTMFDLATLEKILALQGIDARSGQGATQLNEAKLVMQGYFETGKFKTVEAAVEAFNFFNGTAFSKANNVKLVYDAKANALNVLVDGAPMKFSNNDPVKIPLGEKGNVVVVQPHVEHGVPGSVPLPEAQPAQSAVRSEMRVALKDLTAFRGKDVTLLYQDANGTTRELSGLLTKAERVPFDNPNRSISVLVDIKPDSGEEIKLTLLVNLDVARPSFAIEEAHADGVVQSVAARSEMRGVDPAVVRVSIRRSKGLDLLRLINKLETDQLRDATIQDTIQKTGDLEAIQFMKDRLVEADLAEVNAQLAALQPKIQDGTADISKLGALLNRQEELNYDQEAFERFNRMEALLGKLGANQAAPPTIDIKPVLMPERNLPVKAVPVATRGGQTLPVNKIGTPLPVSLKGLTAKGASLTIAIAPSDPSKIKAGDHVLEFQDSESNRWRLELGKRSNGQWNLGLVALKPEGWSTAVNGSRAFILGDGMLIPRLNTAADLATKVQAKITGTENALTGIQVTFISQQDHTTADLTEARFVLPASNPRQETGYQPVTRSEMRNPAVQAVVDSVNEYLKTLPDAVDNVDLKPFKPLKETPWAPVTPATDPMAVSQEIKALGKRITGLVADKRKEAGFEDADKVGRNIVSASEELRGVLDPGWKKLDFAVKFALDETLSNAARLSILAATAAQRANVSIEARLVPTISVIRTQKGLEIVIRDNGAGFDLAQLTEAARYFAKNMNLKDEEELHGKDWVAATLKIASGGNLTWKDFHTFLYEMSTMVAFTGRNPSINEAVTEINITREKLLKETGSADFAGPITVTGMLAKDASPELRQLEAQARAKAGLPGMTAYAEALAKEATTLEAVTASKSDLVLIPSPAGGPAILVSTEGLSVASGRGRFLTNYYISQLGGAITTENRPQEGVGFEVRISLPETSGIYGELAQYYGDIRELILDNAAREIRNAREKGQNVNFDLDVPEAPLARSEMRANTLEQIVQTANLTPAVLTDAPQRKEAIKQYNVKVGGIPDLIAGRTEAEIIPVPVAVPLEATPEDRAAYLQSIKAGERATTVFAAGRATRLKMPHEFDELGIAGLTPAILRLLPQDEKVLPVVDEAMRALITRAGQGVIEGPEDLSIIQRQLIQLRLQLEELVEKTPQAGVTLEDLLGNQRFVVVVNAGNRDALANQLKAIKFAGLKPENVFLLLQPEQGGLEVLKDGSLAPFNEVVWPEGHGDPFIGAAQRVEGGYRFNAAEELVALGQTLRDTLLKEGVKNTLFTQVNDMNLLKDIAAVERWQTGLQAMADRGSQMAMEMVDNKVRENVVVDGNTVQLPQKGGATFVAPNASHVMRDTIALGTLPEKFQRPERVSRMFYIVGIEGMGKLTEDSLPAYLNERNVDGRVILTREFYSGDASSELNGVTIQQQGYDLVTFKIRPRIPVALGAFETQNNQPRFQQFLNQVAKRSEMRLAPEQIVETARVKTGLPGADTVERNPVPNGVELLKAMSNLDTQTPATLLVSIMLARGLVTDLKDVDKIAAAYEKTGGVGDVAGKLRDIRTSLEGISGLHLDNLPGVMVIASDRFPAAEEFKVAGGLAALRPNLAIQFIVETDALASDVQALNKARSEMRAVEKAIQSGKDANDRVIGNRFQVKETQRARARRDITQSLQQLPNMLYRKMKNEAKTPGEAPPAFDIQEKSTVLLLLPNVLAPDEKIDAFSGTTVMTNVGFAPDDSSKLRASQNIVGANVTRVEKYEELDEKDRQALQKREDKILEIIRSGLAAFSEQLWTGLQAAFKVSTSA